MSALLLDNSRVGIQWMHFTFILLSPLKIFSNIIEWCILSVAGQMPGERAHDRERNLHLDSNWPSQHHPVGGSLWLPRREVPCHGVCAGDHHGVLFFSCICNTWQTQGGDLFDAIATDIKYTEGVARDMIHDLADALQVIFAICHVNIIILSYLCSSCSSSVPAWSDDMSPRHQARKSISHRSTNNQGLETKKKWTILYHYVSSSVAEAGRLWPSGGGAGAPLHSVRNSNLCGAWDPGRDGLWC